MKQRDLLDYLFILKLTPLSKEWQPECTKMMKANFGARVSDDKIEKMAKSFSAFCRTAWVKARHQRKTFMHKHRVRLEQEFDIPFEGVHLTSTQDSWHLDRQVMASHADTKLMAADGRNAIYLNRAILASASPMLQAALIDTEIIDNVCIFTELSISQLKVFHEIVTTGFFVLDGKNAAHHFWYGQSGMVRLFL